MGKNVVLAGMMGAGKTSVGELLAKKFGLHFIDIDRIIELGSGTSISQIFADNGEDYFRELEKTAISTFANENDTII